ncbi:hypothetical protein GCM10010236_24530 [Streptomyces eurythermus]|nr:hypothetical protein GCM10010236_24530 [Streptomyces eurythermus]
MLVVGSQVLPIRFQAGDELVVDLLGEAGAHLDLDGHGAAASSFQAWRSQPDPAVRGLSGRANVMGMVVERGVMRPMRAPAASPRWIDGGQPRVPKRSSTTPECR